MGKMQNVILCMEYSSSSTADFSEIFTYAVDVLLKVSLLK